MSKVLEGVLMVVTLQCCYLQPSLIHTVKHCFFETAAVTDVLRTPYKASTHDYA